MCELHDWAGELPDPREPVHLLPVLDGVARVEPVCVLELYRFSLQRICINIQLNDGSLELFPVDEDILLPLEHVSQVVEYKEEALVFIGSDEDICFLEFLLFQ